MYENNVLLVKHLVKGYYHKDKTLNKVLKGISLCLKPGERIGITGPSGCGKTTLLRLIAGLEQVDAGKILINNRLVSEKGYTVSPYKRRLGYVFQTPALWPHMTVEQNLIYTQKSLNIEIKWLLEKFEISKIAEHFPSQISGGQAKRVAIARAIASGSHLILMDEPLTNLEKELKASILEVLDDYLFKTNTGLIYVSHDQKELKAIVSKSYSISKGVLYDV